MPVAYFGFIRICAAMLRKCDLLFRGAPKGRRENAVVEAAERFPVVHTKLENIARLPQSANADSLFKDRISAAKPRKCGLNENMPPAYFALSEGASDAVRRMKSECQGY